MSNQELRPRIGLVGLGNIGMRHLQGLSTLASSIYLEGVDPNLQSCEAAQSEWRRLSGCGAFHANMSALEGAEILVIATAARERRGLFRQSVGLARRGIILEKVVFQNESDFDSALLESRASGVAVHVNCPRRIWPIYKHLKDLVREEGFVGIDVKGRNIGLACNSIHYIDLLQFISGETGISPVSDDIGEIVGSKRNGYYECFGKMEFVTPSGRRLRMSVTPEDAPNTTIDFETGRRTISIDEAAGTLTEAVSGNLISAFGRPPYQSELSGDVVSRLISGLDCGLADLEESALAHAPLLKILRRHFDRAGMDLSGGVPIT